MCASIHVRDVRRGRGPARCRVHPSRRAPRDRRTVSGDHCAVSERSNTHRAPCPDRVASRCESPANGANAIVTERAPPGSSPGRSGPVTAARRASREQCIDRNRRGRGLHNGDVVHIARSVSAVTCEARVVDHRTQQGSAHAVGSSAVARRVWVVGQDLVLLSVDHSRA
jgi:hypothetical protein